MHTGDVWRRVEAAVDPSPEEGKAEMVRSAAERAFLPTRNLVEEIGDMMLLTGRTIWSALRPPYPYGGEFISQFLFAVRLCWFPMLVSIVTATFGTVWAPVFCTCSSRRAGRATA